MMFWNGVLFMFGLLAAGFAVRMLVGAWERGGGPQLDFEAAGRARETRQYLDERKTSPRVERAMPWIGLGVIAVVVLCGLVGALSH